MAAKRKAAKKKSASKKASKKKSVSKKAASSKTTHHPQVHHVQHTAHTTRAPRSVGLGVGVLGLILNIIIPGLGSLVSRRVFAGSWQLLIFVVGVVITQVHVIGFLLWLIAWVWALVTSIIVIKNAI